ncbi:MAG: hypothetical protein ABFS42_02330 [Candidatus Krumholzibacteriota bacterium]
MNTCHQARFPAVILFSLCALAALIASPAPAGIGGPHGEYSMAYQGPETLTLFVVPDGSGDTFDQAFLPVGGRVDATITLILRDAGEQPIANFPREDMWLESEDGGLTPCPMGNIADANTDANGMTYWQNPMYAGGNSQALTVVMVSGMLIEYTVGVPLSYNSPDINADRVVNLTDVQMFTLDFFTGYDFRSDFYRDGVVNLSDLPALAYAIGAACP